MIGILFHRWLVIGDAPRRLRRRELVCACECGIVKTVPFSRLNTGRSKMCQRCHKSAYPRRSRGRWHTAMPEYQVWRSMINRCTRPRQKDYPHYGGRGILVCERWLTSFSAFMDDIGERPPGTSIDRIDVNGNYEPSNCRWATVEEQANNRPDNRMLTHGVLTMTASQWARRLGVSCQLLDWRLKTWGTQRALTTVGRVAKGQPSGVLFELADIAIG
jgi:hypothetical protein